MDAFATVCKKFDQARLVNTGCGGILAEHPFEQRGF